MSEPQGTEAPQTPSTGELVHDAASWARGVGFDQLGLALDAVAGELGYQSAGESTALPTEGSGTATA